MIDLQHTFMQKQ